MYVNYQQRREDIPARLWTATYQGMLDVLYFACARDAEQLDGAVQRATTGEPDGRFLLSLGLVQLVGVQLKLSPGSSNIPHYTPIAIFSPSGASARRTIAHEVVLHYLGEDHDALLQTCDAHGDTVVHALAEMFAATCTRPEHHRKGMR